MLSELRSFSERKEEISKDPRPLNESKKIENRSNGISYCAGNEPDGEFLPAIKIKKKKKTLDKVRNDKLCNDSRNWRAKMQSCF
jgi:hypothetical protein